ncbi:MAG: hypothetical protein LBM75_05780 [Myxococcales bacterium]|jgi:hypothetical protein|nr:hypothetical protein [Myxococcales bacterium]
MERVGRTLLFWGCLGLSLWSLACGDGGSSAPGDFDVPDAPDATEESDSGNPPPIPEADAGYGDDDLPYPLGSAGPWPLTAVRFFGEPEGLPEDGLADVSTDLAQNVWVAHRQAIYLLRPGSTRFERFGPESGLHIDDAMPPGITALTGGGLGEVFVGYQGADITDVQSDPQRFKGKLDRAILSDGGTLSVAHYDIHNNDAVGFDENGEVIRLPDGSVDPAYTDWSFHEDRTVLRFLYDHQFFPGTLYVGFNHGVARIDAGRPDPIHGFDYADHVHPDVYDANGIQRMGDFRALALDPSPRKTKSGDTQTGMLWMGGRWTAGARLWTPGLWEWTSYAQNPFWLAFSNPPVFPVAEGDDIYVMGIAALSDGAVFFASGPGNWGFAPLGIARWKDGQFSYFSPEADLGLPSRAIVDMQRLPDDSILLALEGQGLWRWHPKDPARANRPERVEGLTGYDIRRVSVDDRVSPPAVYLVTNRGIAALRLEDAGKAR